MPRADGIQQAAQAQSVLTAIRAQPGLSAVRLGELLGMRARLVRDRIARLRAEGFPVVIGTDWRGYYFLDDVPDGALRAAMVKGHVARTRSYFRDGAKLMQQIGNMAADEVAEHALAAITIPPTEAETAANAEPGLDDLARLPAERRMAWAGVLKRMLDRIARDPEAYATERAVLAAGYGTLFLTAGDRANLAQARELLSRIPA